MTMMSTAGIVFGDEENGLKDLLVKSANHALAVGSMCVTSLRRCLAPQVRKGESPSALVLDLPEVQEERGDAYTQVFAGTDTVSTSRRVPMVEGDPVYGLDHVDVL